MPGETYTGTNRPGIYRCHSCDQVIEDWKKAYRFVAVAQDDPARVYAVLCHKNCTE